MNDEPDYDENPIKNEDGYYDDENMLDYDNPYGFNSKIEEGHRYEEDNEMYDEEGEEEQDPYMNMSMEELKERLPAYMFLNNEEKVEYFQQLNKSYFIELENCSKDTEEPKNVKKVAFSRILRVKSK